jgi:hypothetical protein
MRVGVDWFLAVPGYINLKDSCKFSDNKKEIKYFDQISDYQLVKNYSWTVI